MLRALGLRAFGRPAFIVFRFRFFLRLFFCDHFFSGGMGIKDARAGRMNDVGSRVAAYVLVVAFWAITVVSLQEVYRSLT
jgi:hypothetical protein